MTMRFHYRHYTVSQPVITLGGATVRPKPGIPVSVIGPAGTVCKDSLLDSGADDTIFPESVAVALGIDLSQAPTGTASGVGKQPYPVRYARVPLRVSDGQEQREWAAWVAFTPAPLHRPLMGYAGFLQFFGATFLGDVEVVELTVNSTYHGT
jgi:hypothetical protein